MGYFSSLDNLHDEDSQETDYKRSQTLNITFSTIEYTLATFLKRLQEGSFSDIQIQYEILNHYSKYCDYDGFQNPETRKYLQGIWTNTKFLEIFFKCTQIDNEFKDTIRKYYNYSICKITYDYYTSVTNSIDDPNVKFLLNIVEVINHNTILPLTLIMQSIHALFIVMAKYSSFKKENCVKRVNEFILRLGYDWSVKQIIDIYYQLYVNDSFGQVFNITMTQTYDLQKLNQSEVIMYHRMNHAMLILVNSMPSIEIKKLLLGYSSYVGLYNKETRFDIKNPGEDYDRLKAVLDQLIIDGVEFR